MAFIKHLNAIQHHSTTNQPLNNWQHTSLPSPRLVIVAVFNLSLITPEAFHSAFMKPGGFRNQLRSWCSAAFESAAPSSRDTSCSPCPHINHQQVINTSPSPSKSLKRCLDPLPSAISRALCAQAATSAASLPPIKCFTWATWVCTSIGLMFKPHSHLEYRLKPSAPAEHWNWYTVNRCE